MSLPCSLLPNVTLSFILETITFYYIFFFIFFVQPNDLNISPAITSYDNLQKTRLIVHLKLIHIHLYIIEEKNGNLVNTVRHVVLSKLVYNSRLNNFFLIYYCTQKLRKLPSYFNYVNFNYLLFESYLNRFTLLLTPTSNITNSYFSLYTV